MPIFEANLEDIVVSNHQGGRLHFTTSLAEAIPDADVVILAVGTPDNADGSVNLDAVFAAGRLVAEHLQGSPVVEIGRTSGGERVCQYVEIWVVAVSLKKK